MSDNKNDKGLDKKDGLNVRAKPPKASELNKNNILLIAGIVALIVMTAVILSFSSSGKNKSNINDDYKIKAANVNLPNDNSILNKLPSSYQDNKKIDNLLGLDKKPVVIEKENPELENKLNSLMTDLRTQQQQIYRLQQEKSMQEKKMLDLMKNPQKPTFNTNDQEALSASIFFPGGAPEPIKDKKNDDDNKNSAASAKSLKEMFLHGKVNKDVTNQNTIQYQISPYTIFAGSVIPAVLQSKLVSNTPGMIIAKVTRDVYDTTTGKFLIIPKGSTLIGEYNSKVSYGDYQMQAKFIRLIRPNGSSIILPNQIGTDGNGAAGFADEVDNHWGTVIGAAVLSAIFNIPSVIATSQNNSVGYYDDNGNYVQPSSGTTIKNSALTSIGQTASQVGGKIVDRSLNIQPTIIINQGYRFNVLVTKDIVLPPYNRNF